MAERATFCPRCHHMHVGVCKEVMGLQQLAVPAQSVDPGLRQRVADELARQVMPTTSFEDLKAKFDRRSYQRDYMRKRRADSRNK